MFQELRNNNKNDDGQPPAKKTKPDESPEKEVKLGQSPEKEVKLDQLGGLVHHLKTLCSKLIHLVDSLIGMIKRLFTILKEKNDELILMKQQYFDAKCELKN